MLDHLAAVSEPAAGVIRISSPLPFSAPAHINCYVLRGERAGTTLVDTGMLVSEPTLRAGLAAAGVTIDRIVLTHGHPDHWGLARRLGVPVLAHPRAARHMRFREDPGRAIRAALPGRTPSAALVELLSSYETATAGVPNTSPLIGGQTLGDWTIVETPGHAPDHICLFRERDRVLISGDHLLPDVTPNINLTPDSPDALEDYLRSLDRTSDLDPRLVLPAHGEPFADALSQAKRVGAHHARRLERLRMLLSDVPTSTASLARDEFGALADAHDQVLAEMETHAHLEHLRRRGLARSCGAGQWLAS